MGKLNKTIYTVEIDQMLPVIMWSLLIGILFILVVEVATL